MLSDQRQQLDYITKVSMAVSLKTGALKPSVVVLQIKDWCTYDLSALRSDAENKRHTLTALRIEVSEGPTVSSPSRVISTGGGGASLPI